MDIPRNPPNPERDAAIKARQNVAGKFGLVLGCIAAIVAIALNFYWNGLPTDVVATAFYVLIAALNLPVGISLGLLFEKWSRPKNLRLK